MKKEFSIIEDAIIKRLYPVKDTGYVAALCDNKTTKQVAKRAWDIGVKKTEAFKSEQKRLAGTKNLKCKIYGCNNKHDAKGFCHRHYALYLRGTINELGEGTVATLRPWSKTELNCLVQNWPDSSTSEILKSLPERNIVSIRNKAAELRIKKSTVGLKKCHSEKMTELSKIKNSCSQRGIDISDFDGFVTSINIRIRATDKYKQWRNSVYKRDNFICQKCKTPSGGNLQAHHIIPLSYLISAYQSVETEVDLEDDFFYEIKNGQTLCKPCHEELHWD